MAKETIGSTLARAFFGSRQAQVAALAYVVLFIVVVIVMTSKKTNSADEEKLNTWDTLFSIFLIAIGYILSVFAINCLTFGDKIGACPIFAWVQSAIVVFFAIVIILTIVFAK